MFGNNKNSGGIGNALGNAISATTAGVAAYSIARCVRSHLEEIDAKKAEHEARMKEMEERKNTQRPNIYNSEPITAEALNSLFLPKKTGEMSEMEQFCRDMYMGKIDSNY